MNYVVILYFILSYFCSRHSTSMTSAFILTIVDAYYLFGVILIIIIILLRIMKPFIYLSNHLRMAWVRFLPIVKDGTGRDKLDVLHLGVLLSMNLPWDFYSEINECLHLFGFSLLNVDAMTATFLGPFVVFKASFYSFIIIYIICNYLFIFTYQHKKMSCLASLHPLCISGSKGSNNSFYLTI